MADYEFWLTDDAGRRITLLKDISFASLSRTTRGFGTIHIGMPFDAYDVRPIFFPDRRVDVWRSQGKGFSPRREGSFFLRKWNAYQRETDNVLMIEFYGRSPLDILRRRSMISTTTVALPSSFYQRTDLIDNLMKDLVRDHFTIESAFLPAGTLGRTTPLGELTVDGDESDGPSTTGNFLNQNVLDMCQDLKNTSFMMNKITPANRRIFFDVVEGSPLSGGGFGYTFRTYADLRGVDRTDGVKFSIENGNIRAPSYYENHLESATNSRIQNLSTPTTNAGVTSPDETLSRWNFIQVAQATSEADAGVNTMQANKLLQENAADKSLGVTFLDSPGSDRQPASVYGRDWDLGDLLPVSFVGLDFDAEVETVWISVNDKGEENIIGLSSSEL